MSIGNPFIVPTVPAAYAGQQQQANQWLAQLQQNFKADMAAYRADKFTNEAREVLIKRLTNLGVVFDKEISNPLDVKNIAVELFEFRLPSWSKKEGLKKAFAQGIALQLREWEGDRPSESNWGVGRAPVRFIEALDIDNLNINFATAQGNCKASSTYLRIPAGIACEQYYFLPNEGKIKLRTVDEVNAWFDKLEKELPFWKAQCEKLTEIKKEIKEEGKPFKDTMNLYNKRTQLWKDARKNYEDMILSKLTKLTLREEIMADERKDS